LWHATAVEHGWWDGGEGQTFGEKVALMHSELSEALEAYRNSEPDLHYRYPGYAPSRYETRPEIKGELGKPEGVAAEFADTIIRIMDYCGYTGIPLAEALIRKARFNETRPHKHGGKKI
jgi:NTP pyrophosphatase (non-canonical NTP hydrolase)